MNLACRAVQELLVWAAKACPELFDRTITDPLGVREKKNHALLLKIALKVTAIVNKIVFFIYCGLSDVYYYQHMR